MSAGTWAALAAAGGVGAVARVLAGHTLVVNLSGALALGLLIGAGVGGDALRVAGGGFLGGYTTFSTWMLEADDLRDGGERRRAALDVALPLLAGLAAIALGRHIGGLA
jgi:CrcB protein